MIPSRTFQELSQALSEKERKELLDKIKSSLSLQEDSQDRIFHKDLDSDERQLLMERDLKTLGIFQRLLLWLKGKILGKKPADIFMQYKIHQIKRNIQRKNPGLTGFETRDLTPKFARIFFQLYSVVLPLKDLFQHLWTQPEVFEGCFTFVIENKVENPAKHLFDLITIDSLIKIYSEDPRKTRLKDELLSLTRKYVEDIPQNTFKTVEQGILPLYNLKEIILYPYLSFFKLFQFIPSQDTHGEVVFKSASAILCLEHLESIYFALYLAAKIKEPINLESDFLKALRNIELEDVVSKYEASDEVSDEQTAVPAEGLLYEEVKEIVRRSKSILKEVSIPEIIRYFKKDPYYQFLFYTPTLELQEFYHAVLKMRFLKELDNIFPEVRKRYIDQEIDAVFEGKRLKYFQNYREYKSIDYKTMELPLFSYTKTLTLLYNYIQWYYRMKVQELVQILDRGILQQNRLVKDRLLHFAGMIEDVEDKIRNFDFSLSPDSEDGKLFQRLRFSLAQDASHQKVYRTLVLQKDREVRDLIDSGKEGFTGLKKIISDLLNSTSEVLKNQLRGHYLISGKPTPLQTVLEQKVAHIDRFLRLLDQVYKVERS